MFNFTTRTNRLENLTAVVLAGGLGTRLRSVVADRQKVLAEVNGTPFLHFILEQLQSAGLRHVVLCVGYKGEHVQKCLGKSYGRLSIDYSHEKVLVGTAGALREAVSLMRSETILVVNGDSYCHADLSHFASFFYRKKASCSMILVKMENTARFGRVLADEEGNIIQFREKDGKNEPGWINAGIYLMEQSILRKIPPSGPVSLEKEIFPSLVGNGLYGYFADAPFIDIGTPESYAKAEAFFQEFRTAENTKERNL